MTISQLPVPHIPLDVSIWGFLHAIMLQSQTTTIKTVSKPIFNATNTSRQTLKSCCNVRALMREAWAENRLFDFNLWAVGAGASAKFTASLDYRLISQPEGKTVVIGVLSSLQMALEECKRLGIQQDLGQDVPCVSGSAGSPVSDEHQNSYLFPSWSDKSNSDSSSDASGTESAQDSLSLAMKGVEDLIDQLIQLGKTIRSSGATSRLHKADKSFDPAAQKDLQRYLTVLLFANSHAMEDQRPSVEHIDGKTPCPTFDFAAIDLLDPEHQRVVNHLISANLKRRNRFEYARRHGEKLAVHYDPQRSAQEIFSGLHQNDLFRQRDGAIPDENWRVGHTAMTDTTAASLIDPASKLAELALPSKFTMSRASVSLSRLNYPNPPSISDDTKSFRCPCCFQTLSSRDHEIGPWRKHLSEDILPYTCIFPDCSTDTCLYATRESWKQHMRRDHPGSTYWECLACSSSDTTEILPDIEQFRTHTKLVHGDSITDEQMLILERVCAKSSPASIRYCPLCIYEDQDEIPTDPNTLLNHIGDHIHDFSLLSLPWAECNEEEGPKIIEAAIEKAMKWDIPLPLHLGTIKPPLLETQQPGIISPKTHFAAKEYFAESSDGSSRGMSDSQRYLTLSEISFPETPTPETDTVGAIGGEAAISVTEDSQRSRPIEDFRRRVEVIITNEGTAESDVVGYKEQRPQAAIAHFNSGYNGGFSEKSPGILLNYSLLHGLDHHGFYKAYPDPANPPVVVRTADGSQMRILGECSVKWSPYGKIEEWVDQQIFLNPFKYISCRCLVVPEESPYDMAVGLGTIRKHGLDKPLRGISTVIQGQSGKHPIQSYVNLNAIEDKKPQLATARGTQFIEQDTREENEEERRAGNSSRTMQC